MAKVVKRRGHVSDTPGQDVLPAVEEFRRRILAWYEQHARDFPWRRATTCYQRTIGELLLQRTQASTVARFYPEFIGKYPSWQSLSRVREKDLQEFLRPIGLWRRRARKLIELAVVIEGKQGQLPSTREELEQLPGVSQYMASVILLLCYGEREPLIDVNTARVLERVFGKRKLADIRYDPFLQDIAQLVVSVDDPIALNWAMLDLAATVCLQAGPRCFDCPLAEMCRFNKRLQEVSESEREN